jgi:glycosyltransferase involved in cell wall biosynthesis
VLHIVDTLAVGGAQSILKEYFESRPADPNVHLYVLRASGEQTRIVHANVHVNPSRLRFSMAPLLELRRLVRREGIEVLHCHLFRAQVFGFLLKALFFPRIGLVFHEHGRVVGREGESAAEAFTFRWFLRTATPRVDWFVCISEHTRSKLLDLTGDAARRSSVVGNPIAIRPIGDALERDAVRDALGLAPDAFVLGFASRLIERKGWRDLLEATASLRDLSLFALLAGDGEDREQVESAIRQLGLASRTRLLGRIDWMPRFYRSLDCFVMPSRWEPHGLAHLEAQSFGVPIVVSDVPGLSATVHAEIDAILFKAGDPRDLADCIRRVAQDSALRARLAVAGPRNAGRYTMDGFASQLEQIHAAVRSRTAAPDAV